MMETFNLNMEINSPPLVGILVLPMTAFGMLMKI
jgi:hypothetical protein